MGIWRLHPRYHQTDGVSALYVVAMIRSLVLALIGIFTPVYIFQIGYGLWQSSSKGVMLVGLYYLLMRMSTLIAAIPISRIIEKIGFRRSIMISFVLMAVQLGIFAYAKSGVNAVVVAAGLYGLTIPFYWVARNSALSQDAQMKKIGTQMGWMGTLEQIATMLGPLSAGLIVEFWGFSRLFVIALGILMVSVVPLWLMPHHVHKNGATIKGFWYFVTNRRYTHLAIGTAGRAMDDYTSATIWPLAIFLLGIKTAMLGGIFTVVSIVGLIVRMVIGKLFDKYRARLDWADEIVFAISAIVGSCLWMVRLFVNTIYGVLWVDIPGSIFSTAYASLYIDYEQLGGMRIGSIAYWVYNEIIYSIMVIFLMGIVILGAWYGVWKEVAILTASLWMLVSTVMARESNMR